MDDKIELKRILIEGNEFLTFGNDGGELTSTNYFDSKFGKAGLFYLTFNAHIGRLLIPDEHCEVFFKEIKGSEHVVLSLGAMPFAGREMGELMFEDNSDAPFSIHIQQDLIDRKISPEPMETELRIYSREGEFGEPMKFYIRTVDTLPCLLPWKKL